MGDESIMSPKAHGSSAVPVQTNLRWQCDQKTASNICNYNRHYAEYSGYFEGKAEFLKEAKAAAAGPPMEFYDSNTGKLLFTAPIDRTMVRSHRAKSTEFKQISFTIHCLFT